jgi:hypothetical protein
MKTVHPTGFRLFGAVTVFTPLLPAEKFLETTVQCISLYFINFLIKKLSNNLCSKWTDWYSWRDIFASFCIAHCLCTIFYTREKADDCYLYWKFLFRHTIGRVCFTFVFLYRETTVQIQLHLTILTSLNLNYETSNYNYFLLRKILYFNGSEAQNCLTGSSLCVNFLDNEHLATKFTWQRWHNEMHAK